MPSQILCLLLALILVGGHVSWAQTYRYRTPDGRWVLSDTPPSDDAEVATTMPEGSGPSMQTTAQIPRKQLKKQDVRKAVRRQDRHRRRRMQTPRPVNTRQFGLLQIGSPKAAVLRVLGPPLDKVKQGKKKRMVRLKGRYVQRRVKIETWYYPGSNRLRPTKLVFYDGLLGEKDKGEF
ncbi:DUF2845 domain-containing protein [Candidatus Entotheonella palauensis]|uniref:DUF2845 domain-containing protein n=1 Tax=Candidatus Entotheonella palauensis TaxID=93172 RepID=UPI000B7F8518|nr:DUF2845 domain-containing protein [Candidatus Entotheonella palauensis]